MLSSKNILNLIIYLWRKISYSEKAEASGCRSDVFYSQRGSVGMLCELVSNISGDAVETTAIVKALSLIFSGNDRLGAVVNTNPVACLMFVDGSAKDVEVGDPFSSGQSIVELQFLPSLVVVSSQFFSNLEFDFPLSSLISCQVGWNSLVVISAIPLVVKLRV